MIDHVSMGVRSLAQATHFYDAVLAELGLDRLAEHGGTIGYGKSYPEFWLNERPGLPDTGGDNGVHVCFRTGNADSVNAFHATALERGGTCAGEPGLRPQYTSNYYAAFVTDPDGNKIEAVTFLESMD